MLFFLGGPRVGFFGAGQNFDCFFFGRGKGRIVSSTKILIIFFFGRGKGRIASSKKFRILFFGAKEPKKDAPPGAQNNCPPGAQKLHPPPRQKNKIGSSN